MTAHAFMRLTIRKSGQESHGASKAVVTYDLRQRPSPPANAAVVQHEACELLPVDALATLPPSSVQLLALRRKLLARNVRAHQGTSKPD